jgi:uncharacterized membrane protein YcaP (DUF421 family)
MSGSQFHFPDWRRLLLGDAPAAFLLEVALRTVLMYLALTVVVRLLGKRMSAQMTITETAVMLTLGAIVSGAMQMPNQGVLTGIVVLLAVLGLQVGVNRITQLRRRFDLLLNGHPRLLVRDGVIDLRQMRQAAISHEQIFARLRERGIAHLGQLRRVYLEACGDWSLFQCTDAPPGLPIYPLQDQLLVRRTRQEGGLAACTLCGTVVPAAAARANPCPHCENRDWMAPIRAGAGEEPAKAHRS